jgi:four helix bundle protein
MNQKTNKRLHFENPKPNKRLYFENTRIYGRALELVGLVKEVCDGLPRGHGYLAGQLRRAASSVVLNFAEGYGKGSLAEQRRFYRIARCSAHEVAAALDVAEALGAISELHHRAGKELCDHLVRMLHRFRS